ncbi:MAG: head-tail adaptor protein [Idiomarina sp.]|nr:head-tail adaptor protein [Idiomarina sp.]
MAIDAGKLRHRVRILLKVKVRSDSGEARKEDYQELRKAWAQIIKSESIYKEEMGGDENPLLKIFRTRFIRDLSHRDDLAIEFKGKVYKVHRIENPGEQNIEFIWQTEFIR